MTTSSTPVTEIPTIQRPEHKVAAHIRDASQKTGVSFEFLLAQANQESRLNPEAKSRKSSAMGLFQFTSNTWLAMVKAHGAEHGLDKYAGAITRGADGRLTVKDKELRKEILDLRRDPGLSALMAAEYAKDNEQVLEAKLGRQVSTHDLYLAHFLGAGGALKVLRGRQPAEGEAAEQPAGLSRAAQANPSIFTDPATGEQRSMDSVYAAVEKRFRRAMNEANRVAGQLGQPQVDLAKLRPEERPAAEAAPTEMAAVPVAPASADQPAADHSPPDPPAANQLANAAAPISQEAAAAVEGTMTVSIADLRASWSSFPARLPPRPASPGPAAGEGNQSFPIPVPPPVTGARTDAPNLGSLLTANEERS